MRSTTCETSGRQRRKQIDVAQLETRHQVPRLFDRRFGRQPLSVRKRSGPLEGGPVIAHQALLYPCTDARLNMKSMSSSAPIVYSGLTVVGRNRATSTSESSAMPAVALAV